MPPADPEPPSCKVLVSLFGLHLMQLNTRQIIVTLLDSTLSMSRADPPPIEIPLANVTALRLTLASPSLFHRILLARRIDRRVPCLCLRLRGKRLERRLFAGEDLPTFVDFTDRLVSRILGERNTPIVVGFRRLFAIAQIAVSGSLAIISLFALVASLFNGDVPREVVILGFLPLTALWAFGTYWGLRIFPKRARTQADFVEARAVLFPGIARIREPRSQD